MTVRWHILPFTHVDESGHGCGREATILEIAVSSDGCVCVSGVCEFCGEQFSSPEMPWALIMRNMAVSDYEYSLIEETDLEKMIVQGRPC